MATERRTVLRRAANHFLTRRSGNRQGFRRVVLCAETLNAFHYGRSSTAARLRTFSVAEIVKSFGTREPRRRSSKSLTASATFLVIVLSSLHSIRADAAEKPNIISIFADDWGYGDLSCHGSSFCQTPNLDRMVSEGLDFANFTVNGPVCSPSRVAVMTGQFPARHCVHQHFQSVKAHIKRGMPDWLDAATTRLGKFAPKRTQ